MPERKICKITINCNGEEHNIETHALAGVTLEDKGDRYGCGVLIMGDVSVMDLIRLRENITDELLPKLDSAISEMLLSRVQKSEPAKEDLEDNNPFRDLLKNLRGR